MKFQFKNLKNLGVFIKYHYISSLFISRIEECHHPQVSYLTLHSNLVVINSTITCQMSNSPEVADCLDIASIDSGVCLNIIASFPKTSSLVFCTELVNCFKSWSLLILIWVNSWYIFAGIKLMNFICEIFLWSQFY